MRTVGHRGASALAPENTLRAVELAILHGLDFAEVDVRLSRDRQLVVHHDAEVAVAGGSTVPVAELSIAELRDIPKGDGQFVCSLEEVLALASGRIGIYVECKAPGTPRALGELLGRRTDTPELIVGSFSADLVAELGDSLPEVPRSVLFGRATTRAMIDTCRAVRARYAHPCARPITATAVAQLHAADLEVMTPHTNDPMEAQRFCSLGADLIASDDPRLLSALVRHPCNAGSR